MEFDACEPEGVWFGGVGRLFRFANFLSTLQYPCFVSSITSGVGLSERVHLSLECEQPLQHALAVPRG